MSEDRIVARCTDCGVSFTREQMAGVEHCPACGTESVPCDPARDIQLAINWHELRILTIWASNWAGERCQASGKRTLQAILKRLDAQRPADWPPLTLADEVRELQALGYDAEMTDSQGNVVVPRQLRGKA